MSVTNPYLGQLGPYPMARLAALIDGVSPAPGKTPIMLSIGEPKHPLPAVISQALADASATVDHYPAQLGCPELQQAIAGWVARRFAPATLASATEVLPVNGAREGLFSFFQSVVDATRRPSYSVCPNPGYAVYDGATVLSGLTPYHFTTDPGDGDAARYAQVPEDVWRQTQVLFVCSPDNPTGATLSQQGWERLFALSDRYGFIIAADECYCEIFPNEAQPPVGALEAAARCGRGYERLVSFFSLSKRSNAPGLRSGFVAGDAGLLRRMAQFRSYNGGGMSPAVQAASIAAWNDEAHVCDNRRLYREKYDAVIPLLQQAVTVARPQAGFFLWADIRATGLSDEAFTRALYEEQGVLVLPGSYLAHETGGGNPGAGHVRIALVAPLEECLDGAGRIIEFCRHRAARRQA